MTPTAQEYSSATRAKTPFVCPLNFVDSDLDKLASDDVIDFDKISKTLNQLNQGLSPLEAETKFPLTPAGIRKNKI